MSADVTARPCPVCGARRADTLHPLDLVTPDDHPLQGGYRVVVCTVCSTGFGDIDAPQSAFDRFYAEQARYSGEAVTAGGGDEPPWKATRLAEAADRIARARPDRAARVLDIGCANGALLGALRRLGYRDLLGVDPSPGCARTAAERHGVDVQVGTLASLPHDVGTADVVCLTGVLEHVLDMDGTMTVVRGLLRPGGLVYLDLPDASRYCDPYVGPFEDFSSEHINHLSPTTLRRLAARHGFTTLGAERFLAGLAAEVDTASQWALWGADGPATDDADAGPDAELGSSLQAFTARSLEHFGRIDAHLDAALGDRDEVAVWGVGEFTQKLLARPAFRRRRLALLVDGNPARHGVPMAGTVVQPPDRLPHDAAVVVGSIISAPAIVRALRARDHRGTVVTFSRS